MKKFIIVDHSLCSLQGHHYECSVSVAEAALRAGFRPVILANRVLPRSLVCTGIEIIPVFEIDWFNQPVVLAEQRSKPQKRQSQEQKKLKELVLYRLYVWQFENPQGSIFAEKVIGSTQRLKQGLNQDLILLRSIPFSNTLLGLFKIIWGLIRFIFNLFIKVVSKLARTIQIDQEKKPIKVQSFTETLAEILPTLDLTDEDHIFIHTLGIEQLEELYYFGVNSDRSLMPIYHVLLRRDPEDPLVINAQGLGLKACLNVFHESQLWPHKIRFYTDTDDLVRRHNALSPVKFTQIPIPFRQEKLPIKSAKLDNITIGEARDKVIHIVYLGDARSEKGYQHLPDLIGALWTNYLQLGKVKFTIQSNYNILGGERSILEAKLKLAQYPEQKVHLISEPMLPDDYYQLLASADIIVLPYNPQNYQRTSGVLTEALAAGKPVVVPRGSWLAQQVDGTRASIYNNPSELPSSVIRTIENLKDLAIAADKFSHDWRELHSPDRLIHTLLKPINFPALNPENAALQKELQQEINAPYSVPKVLLVIAGESLLEDTVILTGDNNSILYFCQQGYQVYVVIYPLASSDYSDRDHWNYFVEQIHQALQIYNLKGLWIVKPKTGLPTAKDCDPQHYGQYYRQYIDDVYYQRMTLLREWIVANHLEIPPDLIEMICKTAIDLVYTDSILRGQWLQKLGLKPTLAIAEVDRLYAYHYALINHREVIKEELEWEVNQLQQFGVLLTGKSAFAENLKELTQNPQIYSLEPSEKNELEKKVSQYDLVLNQACQAILGSNNWLNKNEVKYPIKVAILYPWGNIQERTSGASQRTGLLLDYLKEQCHRIRFCTLESQRSQWQGGIHYDYYEPHFPQENLVQSVYSDAYQSWRQALNISSHKLNEILNPEESTHTWLPWIYYQFRFDPDFQAWLEKITDWADVVILEYPFWAASLAKICAPKKTRWILTAHDVLAKNLPLDTVLGQITLAEELAALRQADAVVTLSSADQSFFQDYGITSHCVPIGIDLRKIQRSLYQNKNEVTTLLQTALNNLGINFDLTSPFCLFVGSQHQPNIEAAQQIRAWSQTFQSSISSINFVIVGSCWQSEATGQFLSLGKVDANLLGLLYQKAALVLAPLSSGTGMSVKILEAMVYGRVILGTSIAFRGYPIQSGIQAVLWEALEDYPRQIEQLLQQPDHLQQIGQQAQKFAEGYDYRQLYKTYLDLIL
jgi:glycosyltransferase involved in cell wall biosynthesis